MPGFSIGNDNPGYGYSYPGVLDSSAGPSRGLLNTTETHRNYRWIITKLGPITDDIGIIARDFKLPVPTYESVDIKGTSIVYHFAGRVTFAPASVTLYDVYGLHKKIADDWAGGGAQSDKTVWDHTYGLNATEYRDDVTIYLADGAGRRIRKYTLKNAWPKTISHSDLSYTNSEIKTLTVELSYDWFEIDESPNYKNREKFIYKASDAKLNKYSYLPSVEDFNTPITSLGDQGAKEHKYKQQIVGGGENIIKDSVVVDKGPKSAAVDSPADMHNGDPSDSQPIYDEYYGPLPFSGPIRRYRGRGFGFGFGLSYAVGIRNEFMSAEIAGELGYQIGYPGHASYSHPRRRLERGQLPNSNPELREDGGAPPDSNALLNENCTRDFPYSNPKEQMNSGDGSITEPEIRDNEMAPPYSNPKFNINKGSPVSSGAQGLFNGLGNNSSNAQLRENSSGGVKTNPTLQSNSNIAMSNAQLKANSNPGPNSGASLHNNSNAPQDSNAQSAVYGGAQSNSNAQNNVNVMSPANSNAQGILNTGNQPNSNPNPRESGQDLSKSNPQLNINKSASSNSNPMRRFRRS